MSADDDLPEWWDAPEQRPGSLVEVFAALVVCFTVGCWVALLTLFLTGGGR